MFILSLTTDRESKNLKQIVEKIPGFQPATKQPEEMQQPPQLPAAEETMPLKEKLIDRNTLQEVDKETAKTERESEGDTFFSEFLQNVTQDVQIVCVVNILKNVGNFLFSFQLSIFNNLLFPSSFLRK